MEGVVNNVTLLKTFPRRNTKSDQSVAKYDPTEAASDARRQAPFEYVKGEQFSRGKVKETKAHPFITTAEGARRAILYSVRRNLRRWEISEQPLLRKNAHRIQRNFHKGASYQCDNGSSSLTGLPRHSPLAPPFADGPRQLPLPSPPTRLGSQLFAQFRYRIRK